MPVFSFAVVETLPRLDGHRGVILAGPVLESSHNLAAGENLVVETDEGPVVVTCTALPLANWGQPGWVTVAVTGVRVEAVRIGATATWSGAPETASGA